MEHHRLLTTLALVNSRFYGTDLGDEAQVLFGKVYNGRTPINLEGVVRVFLAFYGTDAWETIEEDLVSTLEDLTKAPEVLSEDDISNIKLLSKNILHRFDWSDSPEGWEFWDGVMNNLGKVLGKMDWAHDIETPIEPDACLFSLLGRSFMWAETEQGYGYWEAVHIALMEQHNRAQPSTQYDDGSEDPDWLGDPEPEDTLTEDEKAELLELAYRIDADIFWSESPMGQLYWAEVFENLLRLAGKSGHWESHLGSIPHTGENTDADYSYTKHHTLDINMTWADTPQGHKYWEDVFVALEDEARLSAERTATEGGHRDEHSLLDLPEPEGGCMDEPVPYVLPPRDRERTIELARRISSDMTWSETKRGHGLWSKAFHALLDLAGVDDHSPYYSGADDEYPLTKSSALMSAFSWYLTPQGGEYWEGVHEALEEQERIERGEPEPEPEDFEEGYEVDAGEIRLIKALSKGIVNRIIWRSTPQGFDYWDRVMLNLKSLAGSDDKFGWAHDDETPVPGGELNELLGEAFIWSDTPQGGEYWHNVEMALYGLQESGLVEGYEA